MIISLEKLASAATVKPQGYYEACLQAGTVVGENLELSDSAVEEIRARFSPPSLGAQAASFVGSVVVECGAALRGEPEVTVEERRARIEICEACDYFQVTDRRCSRCGCWVNVKAGFRMEACPEEKWGALG